MSFVRDYIKHRSETDSDFNELWETGALEREIAKQLIGIRLDLGMTQEQFAKLVGVKQSFLSRLENGEQNITIETLQKLAQRAGANVNISISLRETSYTMKPLDHPDEIPDNLSDDELAEFFDTHELTDEFSQHMKEVPRDELSLPRTERKR